MNQAGNERRLAFCCHSGNVVGAMKDKRQPKHPLTRYRESEKLSITELADMLGVSKATVSRWEAGRFPEQSLWPVIKDKTGIRAEDLARFKEEATA